MEFKNTQLHDEINRKRLKIISQSNDELVVDVIRNDDLTKRGTAISAENLNQFKQEIVDYEKETRNMAEQTQTQVTLGLGTKIRDGENVLDTVEYSTLAKQSSLEANVAFTNQTNVLANTNASDIANLQNDKADLTNTEQDITAKSITVHSLHAKTATIDDKYEHLNLVYSQNSTWAGNPSNIEIHRNAKFIMFGTRYRSSSADLSYSIFPLSLLHVLNEKRLTLVWSDSIYVTNKITFSDIPAPETEETEEEKKIRESKQYLSLSGSSNANGYGLYIYEIVEGVKEDGQE